MDFKFAPKASWKRSRIRARLGRRLEPVLGPEKARCRSRAAEWRRPLGGKRGAGLKPCKELSHSSLTRPSARWAGGFKRLTPFRRPPRRGGAKWDVFGNHRIGAWNLDLISSALSHRSYEGLWSEMVRCWWQSYSSVDPLWSQMVRFL